MQHTIKTAACRLAFLMTLAVGLTPLAASAHRHDGYAHDGTIGYTNMNWMGSLDDATPISRLSVPGTHDTMAYRGNFNNVFAQTQAMSLQTQLRAGVRMLDIRCRQYRNTFEIYHGPIPLQVNFGEVLQDVTRFLQDNPSETVFMRVKQEGDPILGVGGFRDVFNAYRNNGNYSRFFWANPGTATTNPTLSEIRGKIVILWDHGSPIPVGLSYRSHIQTQDNYDIGDPDGLYAKWSSIKAHLRAASQRTPQNTNLFVNYLSGTSSNLTAPPFFVASGHISEGTSADRLWTGRFDPPFTNTFPDFPRLNCVDTIVGGLFGAGSLCSVYYEGTNVLTTNYLGFHRPRYVGFIVADFPGKGLIRRVIEANDHLSSFPRRGLQVHLDAERPSGSNGSPCSPGAIFYTWKDVSGNGNDFRYHRVGGGSIECAANFPFNIHGRFGARFRREQSDALTSVRPLQYGHASGQGEFTMIVAGFFHNSSTNAAFVEAGPNTNVYPGFYLYGAGADPFRIRQRGATPVSRATTFPQWMGWGLNTATVRIKTTHLGYDGGQLFRNGTKSQWFRINDFFDERNFVHIGGRPNLGQFWDGNYFEVLIYDRALSDAEVRGVSNYMSTKWGTL